MTFELASALTPWLVAFVGFALVVAALAVAGLTDFVRSNRPVRVARQESVRSYYGRLALHH